jgi:precorrin-2/cobalt-factor-2 C20-methyltransferase
MNTVSVTFLSLGPGDPELLTLKAIRLLKDADIVIVPATRGTDGEVRSRAKDIIAEWCDENRLMVFELPMLRDCQAVSLVYDKICREVAEWYQKEKRVVVAGEGDVSIFASIHYVMERLKEKGIVVEQVAGIPSFIAAAAKAGISLASQHQRLIIIPGDANFEALEYWLNSNHVVVVMKLSQCQEEIKRLLKEHPNAVCHYYENIGLADEYYTMENETILARSFPYFSLCILFPY